MKCPVCGYDVPDGKQYCPLCGNSMEQDPGEELMFRNTSEPENVFDPESDDTQINWNTFDFEKPRDFRDITMDWSQADFSEAVERAARSMDARAEARRNASAAKEAADPAENLNKGEQAAVKTSESSAVSAAESGGRDAGTVAEKEPAVPAQMPSAKEGLESGLGTEREISGPRLIIPDFSMPDFSDGWVELVSPDRGEDSSAKEAEESLVIPEEGKSSDGEEESSGDPGEGLTWRIPELFKDASPIDSLSVRDTADISSSHIGGSVAPEDGEDDGTIRISERPISEDDNKGGLDALFRRSTREFDFAPEGFDLESTRIYEHSAAKWGSRAEDEGALPLGLFETSEDELPAKDAESGNNIDGTEEAQAGTAEAGEAHVGIVKAAEDAASNEAEDEPVSYDWLRTQVSPIRRSFFTDDVDLAERPERSPEQFFTFNRKNEEFQKLLDEEYARMMSVQAEVDSVEMPPARREEQEDKAAEEEVSWMTGLTGVSAEPRRKWAPEGFLESEEASGVNEVEDIIESRPDLGAPSVPFKVGSDTEEIGRKLDALFGEVVRKEQPVSYGHNGEGTPRSSAEDSAESPEDKVQKNGPADAADNAAPGDIYEESETAAASGSKPVSSESDGSGAGFEGNGLLSGSEDKTPAEEEKTSVEESSEEASGFADSIADVTARLSEASIAATAKAASAGEEPFMGFVSGSSNKMTDGQPSDDEEKSFISEHEEFDWRTSSEIASEEAASKMREEASDAGRELSSLEDRLDMLQKELEARRVSPADELNEEKAASPDPFELPSVFSSLSDETPDHTAGDTSEPVSGEAFKPSSDEIPETANFEPSEFVSNEAIGPAADEAHTEARFYEGYDAEIRPDEGYAAEAHIDQPEETAADGVFPREESAELYDTREFSDEEQSEIQSGIDELFDGREEAPGPKKMNPLVSLLLTLAIIAGLFEGGVFAMNSIAPQLPFTKSIVQLDSAIKHAINDTFGGLGDRISGLFGGGEKASTVDPDGVDFKAIVSEYNKNIKSVSRNSELALTESTKTSIKDMAELPVVEDAAVKSAVYKTMIQYNSSWIDYVNSDDDSCLSYMKADGAAYRGAANFDRGSIDKEVFNSFELGEIRSYEGGVYIFTRENLSVTKGGQSSSASYNWIYNLEKVGDEYKVVDYSSFS